MYVVVRQLTSSSTVPELPVVLPQTASTSRPCTNHRAISAPRAVEQPRVPCGGAAAAASLAAMRLCLCPRALLLLLLLLSATSSVLLLSLAPCSFVSATTAAAGEADDGMSVSKLRAASDAAYAKGRYTEAAALLTRVIEHKDLPASEANEKNLYKRYRILLRLQKYKEALADLSAALKIAPTFEQALSQRTMLHMRLGHCRDALRDLESLRGLNAEHEAIGKHQATILDCVGQEDLGRRALAEQKYDIAREAFQHVQKIADLAAHSVHLLMNRARAEFGLGNWYEAIAEAGRVLKKDSNNLEALSIRAQSYYVLGELDLAINHYRQCLKLDPEHKECKDGHKFVRKITRLQQKLKDAEAAGDMATAIARATDLTTVDAQHPKITVEAYVSLSRLHHRQKDGPAALRAAEEAVRAREDNVDAHRARGAALLMTEEFEEAVRAYTRAKELSEGNNEVMRELQHAELELKKSKQKDYYKILGIPRNCENRVIKRAYRELALKWHPDKHTEEDKEAAQKKFQLIAEAYEVLSDPDLRRKHDHGEDVFPNQGGGNPGAQQRQHFHQGANFGNFHFRFG